MKLTFKDLKQQKFQLDAEPANTIAEVKKKIFETKNQDEAWDPSLQKLIYSGKILADEKTVEDYKVEEKGFIVCMLSRPKPAPAASSSAAAAKVPSTPAKTTQPATPAAPPPAPVATSTSSTSNAPPATPTPAGAGAPSGATFNDPSALAMGAQREAAITNMMEMGFPRNQIDAAMRAAFYNPDRAVEYLMNGIPEHAQQDAPGARAAAPPRPAAEQQTSSAPAPAQQSSEGGEENINLFEAAAAAAAQRSSGASRGGAPGSIGPGSLEFLRNNPQFQQLRNLVQESPHMLEPILQQVGQGNPQLAAIISQNPEAFLSLLSEGADIVDDGTEGDMPGVQTISVTPEEHDAIDRLCALGFPRDHVIQAFVACDRNEELAANYLFDNPDLDDDQQ